MSGTNPCDFKPLWSDVGEDPKGRKIETETVATHCIDEDIVDDGFGDGEIDLWTEQVYRLVNGKRAPKKPIEVRECSTMGGCKVLVKTPPKSNIPKAAPVEEKKAAIDPKIIFIARVLFAETAGQTETERLLMASVIYNRIGHEGFGGGQLKSALEVARQPLAFSCVGDTANKQWLLSMTPDEMDEPTLKIWEDCVALAESLASGKFEPVNKDIVYYHDHSIAKPSNWDNDWFTTTPVKTESTAFTFYSAKRTMGWMEKVGELLSGK